LQEPSRQETKIKEKEGKGNAQRNKRMDEASFESWLAAVQSQATESSQRRQLIPQLQGS